ncbi:MAG: phenylalanine--tRNA ligase subunit alpha [Nanoarchaeota archaeon]|nr:phenylalanine--tRNA ligase subunit alpha [Nanoarchaeota archaeon]MBU1631914.1 phenylalanine--tRNA ligase subunit alpha [Nanoarchaeota archaeon]MBU1875565.1 phenylalanine--tRNA ligase subunit alpha [Nanoarchaeota archaeon]
MDIKNLTAKLHPLERVVLPILKEENELQIIVKKSKLKEVEVTRALQWLENKSLLKISTEKKKIVSLDRNGLRYKKEGLPEKAFLNALSDDYKGLNVITKKSKLSREEVNACLGLLKRKLAIEVQKGEVLQVKITEQGKKVLDKPTFEEQFINKEFPLDLEEIKDIDKFAFDELKKRKDILKIEEVRLITIELTEIGKKLASVDLGGEVVNRLTAGMLKTGNWKDKQFRAYDVEINVPKRYPGKKHFVNQALDYGKEVWIEMGFKEMTGNMTTTSFWCFDALFTPQDHPVREMQDTFYLDESVGKGKLPEQELVNKVKAAHENGGNTGSKGWQYKWNPEEAKKILMRTHTTILTSQTLAKLKEEDLPAKFFAIGKCFRNETLDWSHLFEFNQTEGIVVDKNVNFRHLLGYLRNFAKKMGYPKVRFRPAFFAYTEPSVEGDVYDPVHKKWIEFIAAGVLRPEVVKPLLGKDIPILAWGPGIDRILAGYFNITDIRDLYKNDLKQIREMKIWLK